MFNFKRACRGEKKAFVEILFDRIVRHWCSGECRQIKTLRLLKYFNLKEQALLIHKQTVELGNHSVELGYPSVPLSVTARLS